MRHKFLVLSITILIINLFLSINTFAETETESKPVLTLEQCLEMAYANSKQLQEVEKNIAIAKELIKEAEAGFLPSINYEYAGIYSNEPLSPLDPSRSKEGYSGKIALTQPLYTGGKLTNALEIAKANLDKELEQARKIKQDLTYQVKEAYYRVWLTEEMLKVAKGSYDNLSQHVDKVNKLFKVGTASKFEVLQAEVQQESFKPKIIKTENAISLAKLGLAIIIGFDKEQDFAIKFDPKQFDLPESLELSISSLLEEAYQNRAELRQLKIGAKVAELKTAIEFAAYKPTIGASLSYEGSGNEMLFDDWDKAWKLAVVVQGSIFNAGTKPKVTSATKSEELFEVQEAGLRDKILLEVKQAYQAIKENIETAKANLANIELAQESLRMTQSRFDAGIATTMDIMDAQLALDQALNGYYQSLADYITALAKLDQVVGRDQ